LNGGEKFVYVELGEKYHCRARTPAHERVEEAEQMILGQKYEHCHVAIAGEDARLRGTAHNYYISLYWLLLSLKFKLYVKNLPWTWTNNALYSLVDKMMLAPTEACVQGDSSVDGS
jgi:hypothetical protein